MIFIWFLTIALALSCSADEKSQEGSRQFPYDLLPTQPPPVWLRPPTTERSILKAFWNWILPTEPPVLYLPSYGFQRPETRPSAASAWPGFYRYPVRPLIYVPHTVPRPFNRPIPTIPKLSAPIPDQNQVYRPDHGQNAPLSHPSYTPSNLNNFKVPSSVSSVQSASFPLYKPSGVAPRPVHQVPSTPEKPAQVIPLASALIKHPAPSKPLTESVSASENRPVLINPFGATISRPPVPSRTSDESAPQLLYKSPPGAAETQEQIAKRPTYPVYKEPTDPRDQVAHASTQLSKLVLKPSNTFSTTGGKPQSEIPYEQAPISNLEEENAQKHEKTKSATYAKIEPPKIRNHEIIKIQKYNSPVDVIKIVEAPDLTKPEHQPRT